MQNEPSVQFEAAATALACLRNGELAAAEALCTALLEQSRRHPLALYGLGMTRLGQQRYELAADLLTEATELLQQEAKTPQDEQLLATWCADLGIALSRAGRLAEALVQWRRSARLHASEELQACIADAEQALAQCADGAPTTCVDDLVEQARQALLASDWVKAGHAAAAAIRQDPANAHAHHVLAIALWRQQHWLLAEAAIRAALELAPGEAALRDTAGSIAAAQGRLVDACRHYVAAVALEPDFSHAWSNLGGVCRELGLDDEGVTAFRQAVRADPHRPQPLVGLSSLLQKMGRLNEAIAAVDAGIALQPGSSQLWGNRGAILQALHRPEEAEAAFREALRIDPDDAELWLSLANLCLQEDRTVEAMQAHEHALRLDPRLPGWGLEDGSLLGSTLRS